MEPHQENRVEHTCTRKVADLFADVCMWALERRLSKRDPSKPWLVEVTHDSLDLTVRDDIRTLLTEAREDLTFPIDELQDLEVEVCVRSGAQGDMEVEGYTYLSDDPELSRDTLIRVEITLSPDWGAMERLRTEIVATLVHEMRHAIQHCLHGWMTDEGDQQTMEDHLFCPYEIDARVEEICSYSFLPMCQITPDTFETLASKYLRDYVTRNTDTDLCSDEHMRLIRRAVTRHLEHFFVRSKVDEFERVTP